METKALKKQMGAAIAMVLVAAIALAASTYAWFVTNNKVDATTSTISATSNAAFMTITNGTTGASRVDTTSIKTNVQTKALYPATFGEETGATKGSFMTGYGTTLTNGALSGNLKLVGTTGSYTDATGNDYALLQDYNISSKGQNLSGLSIDKVENATLAEGESASTSELAKALRILVTNSDGTVWAVYGQKADTQGQDGATTAVNEYELKLSSAENNAAVTFGDIEAGKDTAVHVYLYYEGKDAKVTTQNLQNGKLTATNKVTVYFTATADNK
ncbi:hypothetical protein [uncultured Senegalimassilia sp.]|uniref:hypothetical protein n=1 Tax=uncultured Senegalimassilia sp. TaxID=1714350 RepID=UPI002673AF2C|nr:hypothetical protein [uncultured Senegalimassilia sp.]